MTDIVERLRMYAEDLQTPDPNHHRHEPYSAGGFNGYASAMSLAADEIVKLREYAGTSAVQQPGAREKYDSWIKYPNTYRKPSDFEWVASYDALRAQLDEAREAARKSDAAWEADAAWNKARKARQKAKRKK